MPTLPSFRLPERARRACRMGLPVLLASGLVVTTLVAGADAAQADAPSGTFTIGDTPVALNQATDPGLGSITPTADAASEGMYGPQLALPVIPVHAAIARDGHVISYGSPVDTAQQGGTAYDDWNPASGTGRAAHTDSAAMTDYNSFCSASVRLDDGTLLMVGGNTTTGTMDYDPNTGAQTMGSILKQQRWYGSAIRTADDRVVALGGGGYYVADAYLYPNDDSTVSITPEISDGRGEWTLLSGATSTYAFGAEDNRYYYPRVFNGPNGTIVGFSGDHIWSLSTDGDGSVAPMGTLPYNPYASGSQVMYAPGKVLIAGGGSHSADDQNTATNQAAVVDISGATATSALTGSMRYPRNWLNLTVLPNGEVLGDGGTVISVNGGASNAVHQSEIWNPDSGTWRLAATAQRTRTYHSTALLLPSGAVYTAGGGIPGPEDNFNAELYYPSYLFTKGANGAVGWATRPAIESIAGSAVYGGTVSMQVASDRAITGASLISAGTVTHSQNTDQRRVPLALTRDGDTVQATLPSSANTLPPGDYELTVVDSDGVPSTGQMITIRRGAPGLVTVLDGAKTSVPAGGGADAGPGAPTNGGGAPAAPAAQALVGLTPDGSVGLEAAASPGSFVANSAQHVSLRRVSAYSAAGIKSVSTWIVRPGLASASGVSFESANRPGSYLAAPWSGNGEARLVTPNGTWRAAAETTFTAVKGLAGSGTSFRAWGTRAMYLRTAGVRMLVTSAGSRSAAQFTTRAGWTPAVAVPVTDGRSVGLAPAGSSRTRLEGAGRTAWVGAATSSSTALVRSRSSWVVRQRSGGVSFESIAHPGFYLAAPSSGTGTAVLMRPRDRGFASRAVFSVARGATEGGTSFPLRVHRDQWLQIDGSAVVVKALGRSGTSKARATFTVRSGLAPAQGVEP